MKPGQDSVQGAAIRSLYILSLIMRLYTESGFGKESKQRSRRLVEESREAVFLTTPEGDLVDANG